ncbi:MAG: protein TolR [Alcanivoracaceae bacterium]|uniref:protein TolR n=1 Tax=Alcanivorax sp. MD8A TaxID=1177157 RepID=UPI000C46AA9D|nr:protein TolR [Alcanivorax sp. MD8A]MAX55147.1 protein TolR [Alcanivoracaceae bacterium]MCG8439694.1 protein TolR [Pseudomonadales bacterium]MEE2869968.1 protein TolR [Pseudomonadota bacterium]PNE04323.1 biopolymer transport protein TolR [Alcanivorax sp. MD8A]|tara:strand:+ start:2943 stop:3386 length:444 start_codon:yes stop_codon:yes gene_type:complete
MSGVKVRVPRKLVAEMNVVPYIDVMLVLLVIFMATAPMMTQGINVDLPDSNSEPLDTTKSEPVIISVTADGSYYIDVGSDGESQKSATLETVKGHVLRIHKHKPSTLFLVEGDSNVPYARVVSLMGALQEAGITQLGLVTEPQGRNE